MFFCVLGSHRPRECVRSRSAGRVGSRQLDRGGARRRRRGRALVVLVLVLAVVLCGHQTLDRVGVVPGSRLLGPALPEGDRRVAPARIVPSPPRPRRQGGRRRRDNHGDDRATRRGRRSGANQRPPRHRHRGVRDEGPHDRRRVVPYQATNV